jgi:hypothetical protein
VQRKSQFGSREFAGGNRSTGRNVWTQPKAAGGRGEYRESRGAEYVWSKVEKTHLARGLSRFFKANASVYIDPETGAHLSRRGGFIGWRKVVDHLRDGDYEIMCAVCDDWFVAPDDIGAERASEFSVSKLDQIVDARLGKWTVITCNFTCEQIADQMDVRIASRLGRFPEGWTGICLTLTVKKLDHKSPP